MPCLNPERVVLLLSKHRIIFIFTFMLKKISEQRYFEEFISLVGSKIRIALRSSGEEIIGIVTNAMFDSFLLDIKSGTRVITFDDLVYFEKLSEGK